MKIQNIVIFFIYIIKNVSSKNDTYKGYYENEEFNIELKKIQNDIKWIEFGEKTMNGTQFYYYENIPECNDAFGGCGWINLCSAFGCSHYCGCSISDYKATLKFKKISPIPKTCDASSCSYSKDTIVSEHESSTISISLGSSILDKFNIQNSIVESLDKSVTVSTHNSIMLDKGQKCVILGGYFYWEISGNMQKLCSTQPPTGKECHVPEIIPGKPVYNGIKSGIVVVKDSGFANCYKIDSFKEYYGDIKLVEENYGIWKIDKKFFENPEHYKDEL